MANTPTPHFPVFRMGDLVVIDVAVRDRAQPGNPPLPLDPPNGVFITILKDGVDSVGVDDVLMTHLGPGNYRYEWASPMTPGLYTASMFARTGNLAQLSQTYCVMRLVA